MAASQSTKTQKLKTTLLSVSNDREKFEQQRRELEEEMHNLKGRPQPKPSTLATQSQKTSGKKDKDDIASIDFEIESANFSPDNHHRLSKKLVAGSTEHHAHHTPVHSHSPHTPHTSVQQQPLQQQAQQQAQQQQQQASQQSAQQLALLSMVPTGSRVSDWSYNGHPDTPPPTIKSTDIYENNRLLGRGAFGDVYLVKNTGDNKLYADKNILASRPSDLDLTLKEIEFLRSHRHPYMIDIYDAYIIQHTK